MADSRPASRVVCMCGGDPGFHVAGFLMEAEVETAFVVNRGEAPGSWYRTPLELEINVIACSDISSWNPDLIVTVHYHRLLPPSLFQLPRLGAWNLHLADAERYRGAFPSIRAIANGDETYGVTLHRIDGGIDTGDILEKMTFPIPPGANGKELFRLMTEKGLELFKRCWGDLLTGKALTKTRPQDDSRAETMYREELSHRLHPTEEFMNSVRAMTFPPFPPPYLVCGGRKYVILEESDSEEP